MPLAQSARRPTVTHDKVAVSSLATSGTSLAGLVQGSIERPDLDLWIVAADAPDLSYKIVNAIVHGKRHKSSMHLHEMRVLCMG